MKYLIYDEHVAFDEAIRLLDGNGNGFLPIIDREGKLYGVITDGDLRRGILNKTLELDAIINRHPITEKTGVAISLIKARLKELHRRHMPVVDEQGVLVEVVTLDDFEYVPKNNVVVIMAGGLGTRLGELTRDLPKPMLLMGGKPILLGIIEHFKSQGFGRFVVCVNYKSEVIEEFFGDGSRFGVQISYTRESKRMGTAGALSLMSEPPTAPFFVINGDILATIDYDQFMRTHIEQGAMGSMCIKKFSYEVPYACVEFDDAGNLSTLREKPLHEYYINAGMYILSPQALNYIPKDAFFDMPELFDRLLDNKEKTKVFTLNEYWLDIGRPDDFVKGNQDSTV